jgi:hypothetical protein
MTPAAKPSMTSCTLAEIRITGRNTGRAPTPRLARKPIQISELTTSPSGLIFSSSTGGPAKDSRTRSAGSCSAGHGTWMGRATTWRGAGGR